MEESLSLSFTRYKEGNHALGVKPHLPFTPSLSPPSVGTGITEGFRAETFCFLPIPSLWILPSTFFPHMLNGYSSVKGIFFPTAEDAY